MVLHDVAHSTGPVVVAAAVFEPDVLRHRDLHGVDEVRVPHWLEDRVGETESKDVLNGLLAEVVIDAVDRVLRESLVQRLGEGSGRLQVETKRLLDHDAAEAGAHVESRGLQLDRDELISRGWCRAVEDAVAGDQAIVVELLQLRRQRLEILELAEVHLDEGKGVQQRGEHAIVDRLGA